MKAVSAAKPQPENECAALGGNGVITSFASSSSVADSRPVHRSRTSLIMLALTLIAALAPCGVVFLAVHADDAVKKPEEPWTAPPRAARKDNPVPADAKAVAAGKELYLSACFPCHGLAGKGDGSAAALLERDGVPIRPGNLSDSKLWKQSDGALFWKISEGKTPMPSFQETYTEEQRWQLVDYVRTLAVKEGSNTK